MRKRKANYFHNGGLSWNKDQSFGENIRNDFNEGEFNGVIGSIGALAGQGISGGFSTTAGNITRGLSAIASAIPGPWGAVAGAGLNIVGGLVNRAFGSQINDKAVQEAKAANTQQSNLQFDASSTSDLLEQSNFSLLGNIKESDIGKDGWFSNKARNLTRKLNDQRIIANQQALANFGVAAENLDTQSNLSALANYAAFGGNLSTNGADWNTGITIVNSGGTHEENPKDGVQVGIDAQGVPNLVEEGEVIFNDYVFSDRINVPNSIRNPLGLSKGKNLTFAKAAKKLSKEAEERPNDSISRRGLLSSMSRLQQAQETVRQNMAGQKEDRKYAHGGRKVNKFDGLDSDTMFLNNTAANSDTGEGNPNKSSKLTWLRYAPVVGSAIGIGQNIFSKPDYSSPDAILNAANEAGRYTPVEFNPLGDYLTYRPLDRNYYINKLNAQSGATRRAIVNQSAGNRATALAGLLAANYNAQGRLGDLARQAEEYNMAQRQAVAQFNRQTNLSNAEMGLKAAMANQEAQQKARIARLSGVAQAMTMRDAVDARRGASMSANMTNFFNSLGDIGREEYSRNMIMSNPALYYSIDSKGNVSYKNGYENLSEAEKKEVRDAANKAKKKKAKGGYLTIRRK